MQGNDDLRAALTDAFAKAKAADAPAETPEVVTTAAPETPPDTPDKPAQATDTRPRDERGRFASGGKEAATASTATTEAPVTTATPPVATATTATTTAEAPKQDRAPAPPIGWSAEAKAKWHELPPEIQAAVNKREEDARKLTGRMDEERAFGRELRSAIQPYMAMIQAEGATPASAINSLLNTAYVLRSGSPQQKQQALLGVARQFGIELGGAPPQDGGNPELATLRNEVTQLRTQLHSQIQGAEQTNAAAVQTDIEAFAADPAHGYFEEVRGHMAALIRSGAAKDLQDAYEQACWARPDIRETLLAQQRADAEQKRRAEEKQRAEEARRKAISVTGAPGASAPAAANGKLGLRDELTQNYRSVMNRGAV